MKTLYEMRKSNNIFLAYKGNVLSPWWIFFTDPDQRRKIYCWGYSGIFFVCLFVCFLTYISLRHAHKSSSEFFWSTKCELEIFYVFDGKRARGLLPVPETRSKGLWESLYSPRSSPIFPHASRTLWWIAFLLKSRCVQGNHFRFEKKKKTVR